MVKKGEKMMPLSPVPSGDISKWEAWLALIVVIGTIVTLIILV